MSHTPTPWYWHVYDSEMRAVADGETIFEVSWAKPNDNIEADAAFIAKCVNAHDELVEALVRARKHLRDLGIKSDGERRGVFKVAIAEVNAALTKVGVI